LSSSSTLSRGQAAAIIPASHSPARTGATPQRVLFTITLPLLLPGLVSGWLFAAILSFNEFTASLFVISQRAIKPRLRRYRRQDDFCDAATGWLHRILPH
jgi:ABC-type Fe3+ transport system permease subunit